MKLKENLLLIAETILQNRKLFKEYLEVLQEELTSIKQTDADINLIEAWETWTTIQIHNRNDKYRDVSVLMNFEFNTVQINDMTIYVDDEMNIVGPNYIIEQIESKIHQVDMLYRELRKIK